MDFYQTRASTAEVREHQVRIEGAGAADPDNELRQGLTVTWVSTGRYRFTWVENPGTFVGARKPGLQATTPADVDTWDAVWGAYTASATSWTIDLYVYSSAGNLADLAASSWAFCEIVFRATSV